MKTVEVVSDWSALLAIEGPTSIGPEPAKPKNLNAWSVLDLN